MFLNAASSLFARRLPIRAPPPPQEPEREVQTKVEGRSVESTRAVVVKTEEEDDDFLPSLPNFVVRREAAYRFIGGVEPIPTTYSNRLQATVGYPDSEDDVKFVPHVEQSPLSGQVLEDTLLLFRAKSEWPPEQTTTKEELKRAIVEDIVAEIMAEKVESMTGAMQPLKQEPIEDSLADGGPVVDQDMAEAFLSIEGPVINHPAAEIFSVSEGHELDNLSHGAVRDLVARHQTVLSNQHFRLPSFLNKQLEAQAFPVDLPSGNSFDFFLMAVLKGTIDEAPVPPSFSINVLEQGSYSPTHPFVQTVAYTTIVRAFKAAQLLDREPRSFANSKQKKGRQKCLFAMVRGEISHWPIEGKDGEYACKRCTTTRRTCILVNGGNLCVLPLASSLREAVTADQEAFCILQQGNMNPGKSFFK